METCEICVYCLTSRLAYFRVQFRAVVVKSKVVRSAITVLCRYCDVLNKSYKTGLMVLTGRKLIFAIVNWVGGN